MAINSTHKWFYWMWTVRDFIDFLATIKIQKLFITNFTVIKCVFFWDFHFATTQPMEPDFWTNFFEQTCIGICAVRSQAENWKCVKNTTQPIRNSITPKRLPMQLHVPSPNGRNEQLGLLLIPSGENHSGKNSSGLSYKSESWWML